MDRVFLQQSSRECEGLGRVFKNLVELHNRSTATITENLGRTAANGQRLLGILEEHPIVDTAFIAAQLDIGRSTASSLVKSFEELGILRPLDESRQRYRQYGYEEYLSILRKTLSRLDRHRSPAKLKRARIISHFEPAHRPKTGDYPRSFLSSRLRTSPMTSPATPMFRQRQQTGRIRSKTTPQVENGQRASRI